MVYAPIYKDTYYTASQESLVYTISIENSTIFSGKAYRMPGESQLRININKICRNYLTTEFGNLFDGSDSIRNYDTVVEFKLKNGSGTVLETYRFLNCWEYGYTWSHSSATILSNPVNGHYVASQLKPQTRVNASSPSTNAPTVYTSAHTGNYNKLVCADYVIYYLNARGGVDAFAFEGRCTKTDEITPHTASRAFNNNTREFEKLRYISEVRTSYTLNTGLLTREQAENFALNLIGSNTCYLHNIAEDKIFPVVITNTTAQYKDGAEDVITYEITVNESQDKLRQ